MAKHVVRLIAKLSDLFNGELDDSGDDKIILQKWYQHFHFNIFEQYLVPYIERELRLIHEKEPKTIEIWQEELTNWMNYLQINNFTIKNIEGSFTDVLFN